MFDYTKVLKNVSLQRFKYPILAFALGIVLMLLPLPHGEKDFSDPTISEILNNTKGVGECKVLISDKGVVVVCEGADKAQVRYEIIMAICSYTGYSSDRITILRMAK